MVRGALRGLNLENKALRYHFWLQGVLLPSLIYFFAFNYCANKLFGLWVAKTIVDVILSLCYYLQLKLANWHEIAEEAGKSAALAGSQPRSWGENDQERNKEADELEL